MNKYLIYFKRINHCQVVGQGNRYVEADKLTSKVINDTVRQIENEVELDSNKRVAESRVIIVNAMKLDNEAEREEEDLTIINRINERLKKNKQSKEE